MKGYITYADLKNGTLNLYDLYKLNNLIEYENKLAEEQERQIKRNMAINRTKV